MAIATSTAAKWPLHILQTYLASLTTTETGRTFRVFGSTSPALYRWNRSGELHLLVIRTPCEYCWMIEQELISCWLLLPTFLRTTFRGDLVQGRALHHQNRLEISRRLV